MPSAPFPSRAAGRRRVAGPAELAHGTRHFHEPRRPDCPWCGSQRLHTGPTTPGGLMLDECVDCAHVFQNPRLDPDSLARRLRARDEARAARPAARRHRAAARTLLPFPEPESWLDVGTGSGHFPAAAQEFFPYTSFDGVDPARQVVRAYAAGRVEEAHVGRLTDPHITARLRARYDVVSMIHHLETTEDPRAELQAALTALRPGGHLLLDLTAPHGKWRTARPRPHQLHLLPAENIESELRTQGCTITVRHAHLWNTYRVLAHR